MLNFVAFFLIVFTVNVCCIYILKERKKQFKLKKKIINFILLKSNIFQNISMKLQVVECSTAASWMSLTISFECFLTSEKNKGNKMGVWLRQNNLLPMILGLTHITVFSIFTFLRGHTKTRDLWYSIVIFLIVHYVNIYWPRI